MDPNAFLYLNPTGMVGTSKLTTGEEIMQLWNSNPSAFDGLPINYDYIPDLFNPKLFAIDHRDTIDFSQINKDILNSISYKKSSTQYFFPNIYKQIVCKSISPNGCVFTYDPSYKLIPGDKILIIAGNNNEIYTEVVSLSADELETTTNSIGVNDVVLLSGIEISNIERLSKIAYFTYQLSNTEYVPVNFNFKLYNLLYGFNFISFEDAYIHATVNNSSASSKIFNADDIVNINSGGNAVTVTQNTINTYEPGNIYDDIIIKNRITFQDYDITYIATDHTRSLDSLDENNIGLISEYAIKRYIHDMFYPTATFTNLEANSLTVQSINIGEFANDVLFKESITVSSNISSDNITSSSCTSTRYGIGNSSGITQESGSLNDIDVNNMNVFGGLYSASTCQIDGEILSSQNIHCKQSIYGSKIGIGIVDFETLNNDSSTINVGNDPSVYTSDNMIVENSFIKNMYLTKGLCNYDNIVIENLQAVANITKKEYEIDDIVINETSKFIPYNKNETMSIGNAIVFKDSVEASLLKAGDEVTTDNGDFYTISSIDDSNNATIVPIYSNSSIYIKDLVLKNRSYIDIWNLLKETLGQLNELATKFNNM